jgi:hypothetical protein
MAKPSPAGRQADTTRNVQPVGVSGVSRVTTVSRRTLVVGQLTATDVSDGEIQGIERE